MASSASSLFPSPSNEKPECGVCLEDLTTNLSALPCSHVFHQQCATLALAASKRCPICRKPAERARILALARWMEKVIEELGKDVSRLNAKMRRVSTHSFHMQTENARLRLENALVAAQLEASDAKHDEVARELGVWKRICM